MTEKIINKFLNKSVFVFVYHDITNYPSEFSQNYDLNVEPEIFFSQVATISKLFNIISPTDLISGNFDKPAALFTFDDGFKSYFTDAIPILDNFDFPSINFINYDVIKGDLFWPSLITYLCDKDDDYSQYKNFYNIHIERQPEFLFVKEKVVKKYIDEHSHRDSLFNNVKKYQGIFANNNDLKKSEKNHNVFLGSHLYKHLNCTMLSKKRLIYLLNKNFEHLSRFSNFINFFAYPFGQPKKCFNGELNNFLKKQKIIKIFSSSSTLNFNANNYLFDRIALTNEKYDEKSLLLFLFKKLSRNHFQKFISYY